MKILITHELFKPDVAGGGEEVVYQVAKGLQERGHKVHVLTTGYSWLKEYDGIKTTRMNINRYFMNFRFLKIAKMAKDYDLIQTFSFNAALPSYIAGKIAKKPVVMINLGVYGKAWNKMYLPIINYLMRLGEKIIMNRHYDKTVFLSDYSRDIGESIGMDNGVVINPGVDLENYKPLKKEPFVLFSGRISKQKGIDIFLETAKLSPETQFVIMTPSKFETNLKNVIVSNLTKRDGKEFYDMYGKAKLLYLPSYGEGFPLVIIEAMSAGCGIVSTIPLAYQGWYFSWHNSLDHAVVIRTAMSGKTLVNAWGTENIKLSKQYTWDNFLNSLEGVYGEFNK